MDTLTAPFQLFDSHCRRDGVTEDVNQHPSANVKQSPAGIGAKKWRRIVIHPTAPLITYSGPQARFGFLHYRFGHFYRMTRSMHAVVEQQGTPCH